MTTDDDEEQPSEARVVIIVDTGIVYDLVASPTLAAAAHEDWADAEVLVPPSTPGELRNRNVNPRPDIPPELPGKALGMINSKSTGYRTVDDLTDAERKDVNDLQRSLDPQGTTRNAAECEAVVVAARRHPDALIVLNDKSCLPVLAAWFEAQTGQQLRYQHNSHLIAGLQKRERLDDQGRAEVEVQLRAKKRPIVES